MAKVLAVVVVVEPRNEQRREMLERCVDGDGGAADMRPFRLLRLKGRVKKLATQESSAERRTLKTKPLQLQMRVRQNSRKRCLKQPEKETNKMRQINPIPKPIRLRPAVFETLFQPLKYKYVCYNNHDPQQILLAYIT
ncbi:hypothetical protein YC2023_010676 [Brassica napus]